ncbi:MAG: Fe(2+) transporter permease subunit FeoB [Fibrobacter sp.]|jgi:ferrous iron transport protein B|nr:Fe(2+) transporter permease subunit FeoB [Fibrobacter sp.]
MIQKPFTIAIAGNPNSGKTAFFNALTGSKQEVGNWPGVTVEKKEGVLLSDGEEIRIVDLPGTYALFASSEDERAALDYLLTREADLIVNILDATNLERNLFFTTQLMELNIPMVLAVNMMDIAELRGIRVDIPKLSETLGIPAAGLSAISKKSCETFVRFLKNFIDKKNPAPKPLPHSEKIEKVIRELEPVLHPVAEEIHATDRWTAIQFLENHAYILSKTSRRELSVTPEDINRELGEESEFMVADSRYQAIRKLKKFFTQDSEREHFSDKADKILLNRFLGIPIFLALMYLVFWIAVTVGSAFIDFFDILFGAVFVDGFTHILESIGAPAFLIALLADGMGTGIQTVATFVPVIFFMFLSLSILEDSGYMARAAFIADRFMRLLGLPGKAFVPMLVGFGCSVPALMGTRVLENKRDRFLTIFLIPFMSCGARLPVFALFGAAFFGKNAGNMVFAIYLIGILIALIYGLILRKTLFRGHESSFVMELPPYHLPRFGKLLKHVWQRLREFIFRAGKIVLIMVTVLGFFSSIGTDGSFGNADSEKSVLSATGKAITPVFEPLGVEKENWPASVALFTGLFAKEAIVGTLTSLYEIGTENPEEKPFSLADSFKEAVVSVPQNLSAIFAGLNPADTKGALEEVEIEENGGLFTVMQSKFTLGKIQVFAYLLFILLYVPCLATLGTAFRELGKFYGTLMTVFQTLLGWSVAVLVFQIAAGHQTLWIGIAALILAAIVGLLFMTGRKKKT